MSILKQDDEWAVANRKDDPEYADWWMTMYGGMAEDRLEKIMLMIPTLNAWHAALEYVK